MVPTRMHSTASHTIDRPYLAAIPPNPTIAEVLMNVAPYDNAIRMGFALFFPNRN